MTQEVTIYKDKQGEVQRLTAPETEQLKRLEGVVRKDLKAFVRVGNALAEIRERRIYRLKGTFEDRKSVV